MGTLYFLAQDNSGHWYLVKNNKRKEWNKWTNLDEDDERAWENPSYSLRIDNPSSIVFISPLDSTMSMKQLKYNII